MVSWRVLLRRLALVGSIVAGITLLGAGPAEASCFGPTLQHTTSPVLRGGTVTVVGTGLGTACHDTGPPPPGEGVLGPPLTGIEILLTQDGREFVVARGSADDRYELRVDVVVPVELQPGEADVVLRWGAGDSRGEAVDRTSGPIVILAGDPLVPASTVTSFGPPPALFDRSASWRPTVVALLAVALAVAAVWARRRRDAAGPGDAHRGAVLRGLPYAILTVGSLWAALIATRDAPRLSRTPGFYGPNGCPSTAACEGRWPDWILGHIQIGLPFVMVAAAAALLLLDRLAPEGALTQWRTERELLREARASSSADRRS